MASPDPGSTRWEVLRRIAELQAGFFTLEQARRCAISRQLLRHFALQDRVVRVFSRIYRLSGAAVEEGRWRIPWLWSGGAGTFSHESALELHGLRTWIGGPVHVTVPTGWSSYRVIPPGVILHRGDLLPSERTTVNGLPVTSPERTLQDLGWSSAEGGS